MFELVIVYIAIVMDGIEVVFLMAPYQLIALIRLNSPLYEALAWQFVSTTSYPNLVPKCILTFWILLRPEGRLFDVVLSIS